MSLITCCPSCGTKFRVVADQLRISDGWVRCGRCQEVFDATQALERSEVVPPPISQLSVPEPSAPEVVAPRPSEAEDALPAVEQAYVAPVENVQKKAVEGDALPAPVSEAVTEEAMWGPLVKETLPIPHESSAVLTETSIAHVLTSDADIHSRHMPPAALWEPVAALPAEESQAQPWADALQVREPALDTSDIPIEKDWMFLKSADVAAQAALPQESALGSSMAEIEVAHATSEASEDPVPSFVRQAQRRAWWNQPAVRFFMGMLVTLLPLALALQIALHERNTLVAWKPQWRPAFESMCIALRCELAPRRHIASVVITGSSFHEDAQPHHYRLGLSLQNQSITSVATPAVELTLTDSQDQILVRKVLLPTDIGAPTELAAHSEWTGTLNVATKGLLLQVSGYRVMAFYP